MNVAKDERNDKGPHGALSLPVAEPIFGSQFATKLGSAASVSKPKAPKESADAKAARLAEEERIRVMQARAQADEAAAGRQLLTRKTRMTMRLFGARMAIAGMNAPGSLGGGSYSPAIFGAGSGSGNPFFGSGLGGASVVGSGSTDSSSGTAIGGWAR